MSDFAPRVPPHSLEAEISVLGSLLLDPDILSLEAIAELTPSMFYREGHRKIFVAMQRLQAQGSPLDLTTLHTELTRTGELDEVGGVAYLIGLGDQTPTAAYAEHYARIVREKWTLRELIRQSSALQRTAYDAQLPLEDVLAQAAQIGADLDTTAQFGAFSVGDVVVDVLSDVLSGQGVAPLSTGFHDLDDQLGGGLFPSTLNILAARPAMGKSGLALNIGENVAAGLANRGDAGQVAVVSLEMPRQQLVVRLLASAASIDATAMQGAMFGRGHLTPAQKSRFEQKAERLGQLPLTLLDDAANDSHLRTLPSKLRRLHKEKPLRLVIIDYLQLMNAGSTSGSDQRQQEISTISRALKQLAREFGIPFLVLSQLSRKVEERPNHRPMLSDLRESGALEQDADVVMFIYRDEYYNPQTDQQGIAEIIIGKQRHGPVGTVRLQFLSAFVRFASLAEWAA
ncbi:replicative DNA helicase [Deinococcus radiopugnans ATCC 19172]|nr:replicative DNA helicase [Deinococcus radiopugnans ATCC 19172]